MRTIIGALLFHGPVREGKGWVQQAIAAKRSLELARFRFEANCASVELVEGCFVIGY